VSPKEGSATFVSLVVDNKVCKANTVVLSPSPPLAELIP
jgi:hypothetical protein